MAVEWTNSGGSADLLLTVDRVSHEPLHRQVESSIRAGIRSGRLREHTALPPTRALAAELGVSRGVVVEAYQQLVAEGYLTSSAGAYTRVAARRSEPAEPAEPVDPPASRHVDRSERHSTDPAVVVDFGYGRADVASFPRSAWLRSVRTVLTETPNARLGYLDGRGAVELRSALASYLDRVRGTSVDPDAIVITNGYAQGVDLLIRVLAASGARTLAVEDPSANDDARVVAGAAGLDVVGIPVDDRGVDVRVVARTRADLLVLTPSHQWPTGGVLSASRRAAVLDWAAATDALVLEDDYDAEYRYDRAPVGAMQGLDPDRVAYAGTVSKTLMPGLRVGWLVLPPRLRDVVAAAKLLADRGSPVIEQLTLAHFLSTGQFDRHLRRMRPVYRRRRDALLAALGARLPDFEPTGIAAGLHLMAWLPQDLDERTLVAAAARRGLRIAGVWPYRIRPGRGGVIFGYSNLSEQAVTQGVGLLQAAVCDVRQGAAANQPGVSSISVP